MEKTTSEKRMYTKRGLEDENQNMKENGPRRGRKEELESEAEKKNRTSSTKRG